MHHTVCVWNITVEIHTPSLGLYEYQLIYIIVSASGVHLTKQCH